MTTSMDEKVMNYIYALVRTGPPDTAVDVLFEHVDELLDSGHFDRCNELLKKFDLKQLDTNLIVAVLAITLRAAKLLPYRDTLLERSKERLAVIAPGRVDRLLGGLHG